VAKMSPPQLKLNCMKM